MRKSIVSIIVLSSLSAAVSSQVFAYDFATDATGSTQWAQNINGKVDGLSNDQWNTDQDVARNTQNINKADQKADSALSEASSALNLAAQAKTELNSKVDKTLYAHDKVRQLSVDTDQDSRIDALEHAPKPKDGKDGTNGTNGKDGKDGLNGKDGKNGVTTIINKKIADAQTKRDVAQVKRDVKEIKQTVKRLGAGAAASANLHYNRNESGYAVSVGSYEGATAVAGGLQFNTSANTAATVQVSYDGEGVGASVGFHGSW